MPKNKDLKRLTRDRMQKTGESYTTARSRLVEKRDGREKRELAVPACEYEKLAGVSDDAVRAKTGRDWARWVRWLDSRSADAMSHREIAALIDESFDFGGWWAQTVTVGYERVKGLRAVGQRRDGSFDANKSKTFPVPLARLYRAFSTARIRSRWLTGAGYSIRKTDPEKSVRMTWEDGTSVECHFTAKGDAKSQVAIQHRKLQSAADIVRMKQFWAGRLTDLAALL